MKYKYIIPAIFLVLFALGASADSLNDIVTFVIDEDFDADGRTKVEARLWAISNHAYFYVSEEHTEFLSGNDRLVMTEQLKELGKEFEDNIYPKLINFWGSEPNPGIDNDSHITILITELVDYAGGYYDTTHGFPKEQAENSNEREMLYVNSLALENSNKLHEFLAHELQHLISTNYKELTLGVPEDIWLNEARSEYSVTLAGYNYQFSGSNLQRRVRNFVENPSVSLTEVTNSADDYAQVSLFAEYVVDKYGPDIFAQSLRSSKVGIDSISNFDEIFQNWMIANYLNNKDISELYGYDRSDLINFRIQPTERTGILNGSSVLIQAQVKDWQPKWYELTDLSDGAMKINFSGTSGEKYSLTYITFWDNGTTTTGNIDLENSDAEFYIGNAEKIVLMPIKKTKTAQFTRSEPKSSYNIIARGVTDVPAGASLLSLDSTLSTQKAPSEIGEGSLIKLRNSSDIYVIRGPWKRYLLPGVINMYGHIDPSQAIEVSMSVFNEYKTSNYVRFVDDERVYAVWPDGTKHWFNMTGEYFISSNRSFDAIFIVNEAEINYYQTSSDITR
jgi:hypothetical protein